MDLLNRLFFNRPKLKDKSAKLSSCFLDFEYIHSESTSTSSRPYPFRLEAKDVRVILFRECDRRGRKLLYDSRTVFRIPIKNIPQGTPEKNLSSGSSQNRLLRSLPSKHSPEFSSHSSSTSRVGSGPSTGPGTKSTSCGSLPKTTCRNVDGNHNGLSFIEVRNGFGYQYQKESPDTKLIGEHVFGSVALTYRGPSAKIHVMKDPSGILISRTCSAPRCYKSPQTSCDTGLEDSFSSISSFCSDVPMTKGESQEGMLSRPSLKPSKSIEMFISGVRPSQSEEDSGYSGPPSPFSSTCGSYLSPASPPSCTPIGTPNSRNGSANSLKNSGGSISSLQRRFLRNISTSLDSFGFRSMEEDHKEEGPGPIYRKKLGLAVLIETRKENIHLETQMKDWLFNHQDSLEFSLNKLQSALETAYLHTSTFVSVVYQAVSQFQQELIDLVSAPRLQDPLWLSLLESSSEMEKQKHYDRLSKSLSFLFNDYETKDTNFFISKLLTAVLTHHLGWVSTVAPLTPNLAQPSSKNQSSPKFMHNLVNCFSEVQPYNALWGQLCELTGSIGYPSRMTKTIVVGTDCDILNHILILLSYLIRCSKVQENIFKKMSESDNCCFSVPSSKSNSSPCFPCNSSLMDPNFQDSQLLSTCGHIHDQPVALDNYKRGEGVVTSIITNSQDSLAVGRDKSPLKLIKVNNSKLVSTEKEITYKWRLNDHEKIVIQDKSNSNIDESHFEIFKHSSSPERFLVISESQPISVKNPGLNTSKTMSDFTAFEMSESLSPQFNQPTIIHDPVKSNKLYPDLMEPKEHEQAFSHVEIERDAVPEKDQKLYQPPQVEENYYNLKETPLVVVSGEEIEVEVEKGGKVLFILGEDERLEGLRTTKESENHQSSPIIFENKNKVPSDTMQPPALDSANNHVKSVPLCDAIHSSQPLPLNNSLIKVLPPPIDSFRIEKFRRQGKSASLLDKKSVSKQPLTVYPSLDELKKELAKVPLPTMQHIKTHRRFSSDPLNGIYLGKISTNLDNSDASQLCEIQKVHIDVLSKTSKTKKIDENPVSEIGEHPLQIIKTPSVEIISQTTPNGAESLMGGILDHYSSVFVLHATTSADKLEDQLRTDLSCSSQYPVLDSQMSESVAIVAEIGRWEIELVSSHSYAVERRAPQEGSSHINYGGIPVMISPLVSQITDTVSHLVQIAAPSQFIVHCFEHHLRKIYLKSLLLSEYLLEGTQVPLGQAGSLSYFGGQSLYNLSELTQNLDIDLNDLPLLLSVASTHTPALTQMFGLTFK